MSYRPSLYSGDLSVDSLLRYVEGELQAISRETSETIALDLRSVHVEPKRPREGMIVFADGTDWDPGEGKGAYTYHSGVWKKLQTEFPAPLSLLPGELLLDVYLGTNQVPLGSTWTKIQLDTETKDTENAFDNATNFRYQPSVAGLYLITAQINATHAANNYAGVRIKKNGVVGGTSVVLCGGAATGSVFNTCQLVELDGASDYIEVEGYSTHVSPSFVAGANNTCLRAARIYGVLG